MKLALFKTQFNFLHHNLKFFILCQFFLTTLKTFFLFFHIDIIILDFCVQNWKKFDLLRISKYSQIDKHVNDGVHIFIEKISSMQKTKVTILAKLERKLQESMQFLHTHNNVQLHEIFQEVLNAILMCKDLKKKCEILVNWTMDDFHCDDDSTFKALIAIRQIGLSI